MAATHDDEVEKRKVELLLEGATSYEESVLATAHLDRKLVVARSNLPRNVLNLYSAEWRALIEHWHMVEYAANSDELGVLEVAPGWTLPSLGENWGEVIDDHERERASYHYASGKAVDGATLYLYNCFVIRHHYSDPSDHTLRIVSVEKSGKVFREFGRIFAGDPAYDRRLVDFMVLAELWMNREYPEWKDPFAYWDSPP